jgi:hypothetical protein
MAEQMAATDKLRAELDEYRFAYKGNALQSARAKFTKRRESTLNNAVILQFLEQGFHGSLYDHDRWDSK